MSHRFLKRSILLLGAAATGMGIFKFLHGGGSAYLSDEPMACTQCLVMEDLGAHWDAKTVADGKPFINYKDAEAGARTYKVQHPEFELWSTGIHARSGVSCADCHMPYERIGASKVTRHALTSPMETVEASCLKCHSGSSAEEMRGRVAAIQERTTKLTEHAGQAMTHMLDAICEAQAAGVPAEGWAPALDLQRKAMWRLDFISSENSKGFRSDQESARILAESIDFSRQAQALALCLRIKKTVQSGPLPANPVKGVSDREGRGGG